MQLQLILILISIALSIYFFIKHRNLYSGIIFFTLVASVFLSLINISTVGRILYWLSLVFFFLYPFILRKKNKIFMLLYSIPFIVDEVFRIQHYPKYLIIDVLFLLPFVLYIVMGIQYKKYKNEFSFLTLITGLNLITLLKLFHFL